jgi:DNA-binding HxlR family transcriptional regulator
VVKRISHKNATCPVARPLDVVGDSWSLLIIRDLFDGLSRFSEIRENIGIAKNMLAARLRHLRDHGLVETVPVSDGGPHQEYVLTAKGRDLFPVLVALRQWGERHFFTPGETHVRLVDKESRRPVARLEVRSQAGRLVTSDDTVVIRPGVDRR